MSFLSEFKNKFLLVVNLFKSKEIKKIQDLDKVSEYYKNLSKKPSKINKKFR